MVDQLAALEQLFGNGDLTAWIAIYADADRITDALIEQGAQCHGALYRTAQQGSGLGDTKMQRVRKGLCCQTVGIDAEQRIAGFEREHDVVKIQ